jgi:hypothetical protein
MVGGGPAGDMIPAWEIKAKKTPELRTIPNKELLGS